MGDYSGGWLTLRDGPAEAFPPKVSDNGRYLVTAVGDPWLLLSDSPQGMLVAISPTDMDTYFAAREAQGFNAAQVHIIAGTTFGGGSNTDYETYDDVTPFTTQGDISTPRESYFARLDMLVATAYTHGIMVFLNAAEMIDADHLWKTNGNTKCYNWGAYLGNRYKDRSNIVWLVGNDFQDWSTDTDSVTALVNVLNGIQSADSNHTLYAVWLDYYHSASRDSSDFNAETTLDFAYTYYVAYDLIETERALSPAKPVFLGESYYQDVSILSLTGTSTLIRRQNYWAMLAGACGTTVGNAYWQFNTGWDDHLGDACFTEIAFLKALWESYSWWLFEPDLASSVLTAGAGTKETGEVQPDDCTYTYCARASDGSVILAYLPTSRQVTIDMSKISAAQARCRWFNPTTGAYSAIGTYDPSGSRNFTPDAGDWVLVIDGVPA